MTRKFLVLTALLLPVLAQAHSRSESFSEWRLSRNEVTVSITIAEREVTRLPAYEVSTDPANLIFSRHARDRIRVLTEDLDCELRTDQPLAAAPGFVKVELRFYCEQSPVAVRYRALFEVVPSHVHYARLFSAGKLVSETLITDASGDWRLVDDDRQEERASFSVWLGLGVQHIGGGYDHIAFVIGLLLIAGNRRKALVAVTGFTLGHSTSLAAAVYGLVSANSALVEALIGFTVSLVAVEYFARRSREPATITNAFSMFAALLVLGGMALGLLDTATTVACAGMSVFAYCYLSLAVHPLAEKHPAALLLLAATLFGLIHGFGFAGFLMDSGVLGASLATPLIGFNIGVELGQIAIIVVLVVIARFSRPLTHPLSAQLVASSLCAAGVYWYLTRTVG